MPTVQRAVAAALWLYTSALGRSSRDSHAFVQASHIPAQDESSNLTFAISTTDVAAVTDEQFLSFSFGAELMGHRTGSFFTSERVAALLAGLAPAYFRFSGAAIDSMLWAEHADCDNTNSSAMCINATQLTGLLRSTSVAGLDLVLGLNGKVGKSAESPNAPWDDLNAKTQLAWLDKALAVDPTLRAPYGYELGNEPDLWPWTTMTPAGKTHVVNGSQLANDASALRSLVGLYATLRPDNFTVFGPDTCNCYNGDVVLHEYAGSNAIPLELHRYTWHFYNQGGPKSAFDMTSVAKADTLLAKINQAFTDVRTPRAHTHGTAVHVDPPVGVHCLRR